MRNEKNNKASDGMTLGSVLLVVFVVLKLCKVINWSWWWVLSPLWIGLAITVIFAVISAAIKAYWRRKYIYLGRDDDE